MEEILAELPLSNDVKSALLYRQGPLGSTLQSVLDYETGLQTAPDQADSRTSAAQMMEIYFDAVAWSDSIFSELTV
jgi:c-di-GMP-related signal transduction protein